MKNITSLLVLLFFACNQNSHLDANQSSKVQSTNQDINIPSVTIDGKKITVTNIEESSLLSLVELKSTIDSIKYFGTDCQATFCRLGNSTMYKLSKSGKFFLAYEPTTTRTTIFTESGKNLGSIKIKANNPEYSISTSPLENEPGLLYVDALNGVSKYVPIGNELQLSWKVDWGQNYYMHSYHITKKELIVFRNNYNNKLADIDKYSLSTGNLIESKKIDYSGFETKYIYKEDLLLKYDEEKLVIYDLRNNNAAYTIPTDGIINLVDATRNNGSITGLFGNGSNLMKFSIKDTELVTSEIRLDDKFSFSKLIAEKNLFAIYYYQTNTPGIYSNNTKLLRQGVLFFNSNASHTFHMDYQSVNDYLRIHTMENSMFLNTEGKVFQIDLTQLQ